MTAETVDWSPWFAFLEAERIDPTKPYADHEDDDGTMRGVESDGEAT